MSRFIKAFVSPTTNDKQTPHYYRYLFIIPQDDIQEEELRWARGKSPALKAARKRLSLSQSQESLYVASDLEQSHVASNNLSAASSINSIASEASAVVHCSDRPALRRVSGWAVGFERLLRDKMGQNLFTDFLKKEFSEENIVFWLVCEKYRKLTGADERTSLAAEIYDRHLAAHAADPVNVDCAARKLAEEGLEETGPQIFAEAQRQIFQLMKTDSYVRFLKSDSYKEHVKLELAGASLPSADLSPSQDKGQIRKSKSVAANMSSYDQEDKDKNRRSLLPWTRNKSSKRSTKSSVSSTGSGGSESRRSSLASGDLNLMTRDISISHDSLNTAAEEVPPSQPTEFRAKKAGSQKFCRVILPDESTTVIHAKPGQTIGESIAMLCERRELLAAAMDAHLLGQEKSLDFNKDVSTLGNKEIKLERRVLFRLDLPNGRSVGVKSRPSRHIREVFKPILSRYNYKLDQLVVHVVGSSNGLDPDLSVTILDNQRIAVQFKDDFAEWGGFDLRRKSAVDGRYSVPTVSTNAATSTMFVDLLNGRTLGHGQFDELGVYDPESSKGGDHKHKKDGGRPSGLFSAWRRSSLSDQDKIKSQKVAAPVFTSARQKKASDEDDFLNLLSKVQGRRIDDQRGFSPAKIELPDFLKENDSPPTSDRTRITWDKSKKKSSTRDGRPPVPRKLDLNSKPASKKNSGNQSDKKASAGNNSRQSITVSNSQSKSSREDQAANNESHVINNDHPRRLTSYQTFGSGQKSPLEDFDEVSENFSSNANLSFTDGGFIPSGDQALTYFRYGSYNEADDLDFNDPEVMNKSMTELGLGDLGEVGSTYPFTLEGRTEFTYDGGGLNTRDQDSSGTSTATPVWEPQPHESDWMQAQAQVYAQQEAHVRKSSFEHLNGSVVQAGGRANALDELAVLPPPPNQRGTPVLPEGSVANYPPPPAFNTNQTPQHMTTVFTNNYSAEGRSPYSRRFPREGTKPQGVYTPTLPGRHNQISHELLIYNCDDDELNVDLDRQNYNVTNTSPPSPSTHDLLSDDYFDNNSYHDYRECYHNNYYKTDRSTYSAIDDKADVKISFV